MSSNNISISDSFFAKFLKEAGSAAIGGIIHASVEQPIVIPIEASITQSQVNGKNFFLNFKQLFISRKLYKSLPIALIGAVPKAIVHYSILTLYINTITTNGDMRLATPFQASLIGFLTGLTEVMFTSPINLLKFRMQRVEWGYNSIFDAMTKIYKNENGIRGFWKGSFATIARNSICMIGMVGGYKTIVNRLNDINKNNKFSKFNDTISGAVGGIIGSFISYPFEMLRAARMHNLSYYDEILSKGARRLLTGYVPGASRLVITSAIMGTLIPKLKKFSNKLGKKSKEIQ